MFFEILIATICGIIAGVFTGLIPGVHVNLVTALVVSLSASPFFLSLGATPLLLAVFIISLALTHSFLDSIPSVYLGAPDESQVVAVLPAHQLFLQGHGHRAVLFTIVGSLSSLCLTLLLFPLGVKFLALLSEIITPFIGVLLVIVIFTLLLLSGNFFTNLLFFSLSGLLGLFCFSLPSQQQILLPLLSGLFGTSTLLLALGNNQPIPRQRLLKTTLPLTVRDLEENTSRATLVGIIASFLPGFGSSQAAILASATMRRKTSKDYLLLVGGINTVNFSFSLMTMYILSKARNGAIVGVSSLLATMSVSHLLLFTSVLLIVGGAATMLGVRLSRIIALVLERVLYHTVLQCVLVLVFSIVFFFSHVQGVLILFTSTSLGILSQKYNAQKNMLLGCLLLPVLIYFL